MTKLQSIISQIQELPADEREELVSMLSVSLPADNDDVFELTEAELAELDDRMKNDHITFTHEEVMNTLREKYATDTSTK